MALQALVDGTVDDSPGEVRQALARIAGQHLIEYRDQPEALEWRASGQHPTPSPRRNT